ncbi:MAG: 5-(carboxyamino)imidazole ribonucleotide mutase, partial [Acidiphilium sp. 21-68-69]
ALFAAAMLAVTDKEIEARLDAWRRTQTDSVPDLPEDPPTE